MLIVFEGPDGAGKTSIAEGVQRKLHATRTHCGPPHPSRAFDHWMQIVQLASDASHNVVCDRLHWGDAVYAAKYRPDTGPQLTDCEFNRINQEIARLNGIIVYVTASADVLRERFDGEYIDPDDIERLISAYEERVAKTTAFSGAKILIVDTSYGFAERYTGIVENIIHQAKQVSNV